MTMDRNNGCIILAAGEGKRFSSGEKVLAEIAGLPIIGHVISEVSRCEFGEIVIVVKDDIYDEVQKLANELLSDENVYIVTQGAGGYGTGYGLRCGMKALKSSNYVMVMMGDAPLVRKEDIFGILDYDKKTDMVIGIYSNEDICSGGIVEIDSEENVVDILEKRGFF